MSELSTPENDKLIADVYSRAIEARAANKALSPAEQIVYEVEMLTQEVNSGASFEQYFRWASLEELAKVVERLQALGLSGVADIARRAFAVALPDGLPASPEAMDELTQWNPEQLEQLAALADEFVEFNGTITNALAAFYRSRRGEV
jgi:hypothetical protein